MPLTAAERQRRRREKLRAEGNYEDYRKRQNEINRKSRNTQKAREEALPNSEQKKLKIEQSKQVRKRVAKHRALKQARINATPTGEASPAFRSASAFGKATMKAKRALQQSLPSTPRRKKAAMRRLYKSMELHFCTPLSSSMMQAGVCLRQDTETTLPELTEQHRIREKEEELGGLESVPMAESETECAAPGLNTLEPECVTAHSGVSDVQQRHPSVIKTEADLGSIHTGDLIKTESLDFTELGSVTHLHPEQIKTETDDGGYLEAEHITDLHIIEYVNITSDRIKCESSECSVNDVMDTVVTGAGVDHKDQTESWQCAGEPNPNYTREELGGRLNSRRTHKGKKPYKCTDCEKCFKAKSCLKIHQRIHTGEKPYECTECGKCFSQSSALNIHKLIHTGEKPYKCARCGKCFSQSSGLNTHKKVHTGEKPNKCTECGMCFSTIYNLNSHQRIHTGEKPYKCTDCKKCFKAKCSLKIHQRIHTGEKPYVCSQCGKGFSTISHLKSHQKTHTGEKPYECSQCGKCFSQSNALNTHKLVHTGEKPYVCCQCGKGFSTISNLKSHQKTHTGEKPHECS